MEVASMDEVYISIRPYLNDAHMIKEFIDGKMDLDTEAFMNEVIKRLETPDTMERTDFQILLNAIQKVFGE